MRLHTAYAEAVRELHGSRQSANLARHALASHDLPTALQASVEAGDQALASGGPDEAARHYTKALEIYARAAAPPRRPARRGRAGGPHGRRAVQLGPPRDRARADRLPPRAGSPPTRRRSRAPGCCSPASRRCAPPRPTPSRAWSAARRSSSSGPSPPTCARGSSSMHAQALIWDGRFDEARRAADEAIELADQLELPRLAADVGVTLTWLSQHLDLGEKQPGRAEADHRRGAGAAATCSARCAATSAAAVSSTTTASSPRPRPTSSRPPGWPARSAGRGPSRASPAGCRPR